MAGVKQQESFFCKTATPQIHDRKKQVKSLEISDNVLESNDEKTKFYTGLPNFLMLMHVFNLVASKVPTTKNNALSQFQEFLLVLMRMKFNFQFGIQDSAFRFAVSHATATNVFYRWITVLSERFEFLINWPEWEELIKTMALVFQQTFGKKGAVIMGYLEGFIERTSSLTARAMTWSNYKHHNTVKFLKVSFHSSHKHGLAELVVNI